MEIIMPAAGLSTRFPNMRPKYSLTDWTGQMMFERALEPYIGKYPITIGILAEHDQRYSVSEYIRSEYHNQIRVTILESPTRGPADTVRQIIAKSNINLDSEILIKDCDSFFNHDYQEGNYICYSRIDQHEILKRLSSKSFIISNDQGIVNSIVEKQVVSDKFCVGGYKFESVKLFLSMYSRVAKTNIDEIFVSHLIEESLLVKHVWKSALVDDYIDVGTSDEWFAFNDKAVIFCDIDGTIVHAQPRTEYYYDPIPLQSNIKRLQQLASTGSHIIFTTARPHLVNQRTREMLTNLGFKNFDLIDGLPNTKRILINDYNQANPYPRAIAINLRRDSDNLGDFL